MSFGGVPAAQCVQDYYLWEWILNDNPQLRGIVELGTWEGGFSLYLAAQAGCRGLSFRTYDVTAPAREIPGFVQLDIFHKADEIGEYLRREGPVALLCDGGNKARELKTFSRYVTPEGIMVVHDWGTEIQPEEVPDGLTMAYEDTFERYGSMSRVFRVA